MLENLGWEIGVLLILAGLAAAFVGKTLVKIAVMLIGGGLLAALSYLVLSYLGAETTTIIAAVAVSFIIGAAVAWTLFKLAISIPAGIAMGIAAAYVIGALNNIPLVIVIILAAIAVTYIVVEKLIALIMALTGAALVFLGTITLIHSHYVAAAAAAIVFIAGAIYQYKRGAAKHKLLLF